MLNKSFAEIGKGFKDAFNLSIEGIFDDSLGDEGFFKNLKNNLTTQVNEVSDLYSKLFVRQKDIEPFKITDFSVYKKDSQEILDKLLKTREQVESGEKSWQDYFGELGEGEKWQAKFVQENDLAKISLEDVDAAQNAAKESAIKYNNGLEQMTIGAKAASLGMKALSMVGNILVNMAVTWAVSKLFEGVEYFVNYAENTKKAAEEASSKIEELNNKIQETNTFVTNNKDKYAEYAKGVSVSGENVSLTAEQFEEYHKITNQIAQTFPDLIQGWDSEGNAILKNKGNVEELTNALKDYNKENAKKAFNESEDVLKGEKSEIHGDLFHAGNKTKYEDITSALDILSGTSNVSDLTLGNFSKNVAKDLGLRKKGIFESISSYKEYLRENIDVLQDGAKEYSDKLENSNNEMANSLRNYLQVLSFNDTDIAKKYQKTGEGIKSLISSFMNDVDWDSLEFNGFTPADYQSYLENKIITPITNLQPDVQSAINDFFSKTEVTQKDVDDLVNKISGALQTSVKNGAIPENIAQFILDSIKNSVTTDGNNASSTDSITFKVDDVSKKIDEIQNAYKTLRDAIKEYNKEGYISVDTFQSIMALEPEYLKYLVDENGNLRLDEQALKDVTIARINDLAIAQKVAILDTAKTWTDEAEALKYLKTNLDSASDSRDALLNKQLKDVQLEWAKVTDADGNRKFTDEDIQNNTNDILARWADIDKMRDATINGINNGLGMTGESAKDTAKNIKDIKKIEFPKTSKFSQKRWFLGKVFGNPLVLCFTGIEALFYFPKTLFPKTNLKYSMLRGKRLYSLLGQILYPVASVIILLYRSNFSLKSYPMKS